MHTFRAYLLLLAAAVAPASAGNLRPADASHFIQTGDNSLLEQNLYIVQLAEPPAIAYRGGSGVLAATRPQAGERFDADAPEVRQYGRHLTDQHDARLRSVGAWHGKLYSYKYAFNGFAARLTEQQARKLKAQRGVLNVWPDQVRYLYTSDSPAFLGLFEAGNGLRTAQNVSGEGVVIGVIDSGIAPEHPSFTDRRKARIPGICNSQWAENSLLGLWLCARWKRKDDLVDFAPTANWRGSCEAGEGFNAGHCNNKIIGARFYIDGFLQSHALDPNEFISPRDADGHGTHIASTAAGNEVRASLAGKDVARISGVAPRARIAVYKACWLEPGQTRGSCSTADLQRAIEDAVADGVDIINYSVGNTDISISDPDDLALLAASDAGVLSVVAAGNDGAHPDGNILSPAGAPWVLTVAASSRSGTEYNEAIRINSPAQVAGDYQAVEASFTPPLSDEGPITAALVLADDGVAGLSGGRLGSNWDACETVTNGAALKDSVALVQRGLCDFQVKIANAEKAGAIAVVVVDNQGDLVVMDGAANSVDIPAVMIGQADGQRLYDRLKTGASVEVTLDKSLLLQRSISGNVMGSFSSSGPNLTAPDILKPDVTAPGVGILAAQTPDVANGVRGEEFQYLSGTSMAVPHVAGIAALIREARPDWTPAMIRSALMTTARQNVFKADGSTAADAFDFGAGHVVPNAATQPGLVYEADKPDYDAFICGNGLPRISDVECDDLEAAGYPTAAPELNLPSIALSSLVSQRRLQRRVTNTGDAAQYQVQVHAPPGIGVTVSPQILSLGPGETAEYSIDINSGNAERFKWHFGALTWSDGQHSVRSPLAVRPVPFAAPIEVFGRGSSGTLAFDVEFGYTGEYSARSHGLVAADIAAGYVEDDGQRNYVFEPDSPPPNVKRFVLDLVDDPSDPEDDHVYLRIALFNAETDGDDDLDLYLYYCRNEFFCSALGVAGDDSSDEQIDILFPGSGSYYVDVHGFRTDQVSGGPGANFSLFAWALRKNDDPGNLAMSAPDTAIAGDTGQVSLQWDLDPAGRYLGGVTHADDEGPLEFTTITVRP